MKFRSFDRPGPKFHRRLRSAMAPLVISGVVLAAPACVPDPGGPTTTSTTTVNTTTSTTTTTVAPAWIPAGCYPNHVLPLLLGNVQFSGTENQLGNALQHFTTDGTCSSGSPSAETIVRSPNAANALDVCNSLGGPDTFTSVSNLSTNGWTVPSDAWFCQTPLFP